MIVRPVLLAVALTAVFLTLGLPRWLAGDVGPVAHADFSEVCREHGGTPRPAPGTTTLACMVRYGDRVYRADAITPHGFDQDAARFDRQGCQATAGERRAFIYHPDTGVCERRS